MSDQKGSYYLAVMDLETKEWGRFEVPYSVYVYVCQLEHKVASLSSYDSYGRKVKKNSNLPNLTPPSGHSIWYQEFLAATEFKKDAKEKK